VLNWDSLPNSATEVEEIEETFQQSFPGASAVSLCLAEATEQAFRRQAPSATYLHLATHGYFAPEELKSSFNASRADEGTISLFARQDVSGWHPGLLSGIVLAGANQPPDPERDDGVLTALEVAELDLSGVELVTLSACETGLGSTAGGEGVLGLQRSFQLAGARTTVASLWEVPDDATRTLMVEFYENLWGKRLPRCEALRQAQLTLLREGRDRGLGTRGPRRIVRDEVTGRLPPYYWAAFVLSGDWR
jgi:CHAT domain-containing protein